MEEHLYIFKIIGLNLYPAVIINGARHKIIDLNGDTNWGLIIDQMYQQLFVSYFLGFICFFQLVYSVYHIDYTLRLSYKKIKK